MEVSILIFSMQYIGLEVVDLSCKTAVYKKGRDNFVLEHAILKLGRLNLNSNFHSLTP